MLNNIKVEALSFDLDFNATLNATIIWKRGEITENIRNKIKGEEFERFMGLCSTIACDIPVGAR